MTRIDWVLHIEKSAGVVRPSAGGDRETWRAAVRSHVDARCPHCVARAKTCRRNRDARIVRGLYRSAGLTRVVGCVSGSVYYE